MMISGTGLRAVVVDMTLSLRNWKVQSAASVTFTPEKKGCIFAIYVSGVEGG
jgi:hypothetical protein